MTVTATIFLRVNPELKTRIEQSIQADIDKAKAGGTSWWYAKKTVTQKCVELIERGLDGEKPAKKSPAKKAAKKTIASKRSRKVRRG